MLIDDDVVQANPAAFGYGHAEGDRRALVAQAGEGMLGRDLAQHGAHGRAPALGRVGQGAEVVEPGLIEIRAELDGRVGNRIGEVGNLDAGLGLSGVAVALEGRVQPEFGAANTP